MSKYWKHWLLTLMAAILLTACGSPAVEEKPETNEPAVSEEESTDTETSEEESDEAAEEAYPVTLTDAVGNEVTLETAPASIVSMMPSNTEILFELGLADEIVGVSDYDDYPEEAQEKEQIGGQEFNVEAIIGLDPDVVFGHESAFGIGEEGYKQIEEAGIPVFVVKNATSFDETYDTIETIGQLTGKRLEAEQIIADMKVEVEEVLAKVEEVEEERTVFVETSPAPDIYTPGKGTFVQEMLDMLGAKNIADDGDDWHVMDPEEIVNRNPDVIIVMYDYIDTAVEDVYARDGFDTITAIEDKQVIQVDENLTNRTGPRLAEGLKEFAKAIYPEVFSE